MIIFNIGYSVFAAIIGGMVILLGIGTAFNRDVPPPGNWIVGILVVGIGLMIIGSIWRTWAI